MISLALSCDKDHLFDSWFQSSTAFEELRAAGHVQCPTCGSSQISRALMAPRINSGASDTPTPEQSRSADNEAPSDLSAASSPSEEVLRTMRRQVEENSDYVGMSFAKEARAIHDGESPERPIYGEAKIEDAKKLIDDGIPVAPLPFMPKRKTN